MNIRDVFESIAEKHGFKIDDILIYMRYIIVRNSTDAVHYKINGSKIEASINRDRDKIGEIAIPYLRYMEPWAVDLTEIDSLNKLEAHMLQHFAEMHKFRQQT